MEQTWFITGSSRGIGNAIARAALTAGHRVAATARTPGQLDALVAEFGERVLPLELNVTDPSQVEQALSETVRRFGRIDVLVNNAGYANVAPIESGSVEDFREQFETNFWGVYNVSRAAIPIFRTQGTGLILQISSIGGRVGGSAGIGSYQAAKFAIDGFSRVLREETKPFGVRVLVVEPSGFRTDWAGASMTVHDVPSHYADTVGIMNGTLRQGPENSPGEPERAGEILVQIAQRADLPTNLTLGVIASEMAIAQDRRLLADDEKWADVSRSADNGQPYPVPFPTPIADGSENHESGPLMTTDSGRSYTAALDYAEQMLGGRLEPFLVATPGEPANGADFKRIATIQAFGDAWPRTENLDHRARGLVSVAIAATLGTLEPLRGQIRIALNNGATPEEIVEVFVQVAAYAGVAKAFEGYGIAAQVFAEHFARDNADGSVRA